jgi:hypothetical protein
MLLCSKIQILQKRAVQTHEAINGWRTPPPVPNTEVIGFGLTRIAPTNSWKRFSMNKFTMALKLVAGAAAAAALMLGAIAPTQAATHHAAGATSLSRPIGDSGWG